MASQCESTTSTWNNLNCDEITMAFILYNKMQNCLFHELNNNMKIGCIDTRRKCFNQLFLCHFVRSYYLRALLWEEVDLILVRIRWKIYKKRCDEYDLMWFMYSTSRWCLNRFQPLSVIVGWCRCHAASSSNSEGVVMFLSFSL